MAVYEANAICEEVIRYVNSSNLNYQVNQTPYSVHISIRKKFLKEHVGNVSRNFYPKSSCDNKINPPENELDYIKSEYKKLYAVTEKVLEEKRQLESKVKELENDLDISSIELKESITAKNMIDREKKNLELKHNTACLDIKHLKAEIETLAKDKNFLSVSLKASKKENVEQTKRHETKIKQFETKIVDLVEYKQQRMSEDRQIKIKNRKDEKKLAKKETKLKAEENRVVNEEPEDIPDPSISVSNSYDMFNPLIPCSSSTPCSPDSTTHDTVTSSNTPANSNEINDAIKNEIAPDDPSSEILIWIRSTKP